MALLSELPDFILAVSSVQSRVDTEPDTVVYDDSGKVWAEHYLTQPVPLLRFPGLADFQIFVAGEAVRAVPSPETDERTVRMLWSTQVIPLLRTRLSGVVLHGCAVQLHETAIAFLGASGAGKSTLSAFFGAQGSPLISDDILWIRSDHGKAVIQPSEPTIRLWRDSEDALCEAVGAIRLANVSYTTKGQFDLGQRFADGTTPCPVSAIFVLSKRGVAEPVISQRDEGSVVTDLVQHSFLLDRNKPTVRGKHFLALAKLANDVPVFDFDFPRRYDALDPARTAILSHLTKLMARVDSREK